MPSTIGSVWASAFGWGADEELQQFHRVRYTSLREQFTFRIDNASDPLSSGMTEGDATWNQYYSDEALLVEINKDLDRLHPSGDELFFQCDLYRSILRRVLFVWSRLHPEISYHQGMHDVAAVVLYAFITEQQEDSTIPLEKPSELFSAASDPVAPEYLEADTFLGLEALLIYLEPFYDTNVSSTETQGGEDDPSSLFGEKTEASMEDTDAAAPQSILTRFCRYVQHDLLGKKDVYLSKHLKELQVQPETYCLPWVRLLFAREFELPSLLELWTGMILDEQRTPLDYTNDPQLLSAENTDNGEAWDHLPLLQYACVGRLLQLAPKLRRSDKTECLTLLMHSPNDDAASSDPGQSLLQIAHQLRDPLGLETESDGAIDVVEFRDGPLGIVLTAAPDPHDNQLAVKMFMNSSEDPPLPGQAERSGQIKVGDILVSINGVPMEGYTTEEVKVQFIQTLSRPLYIAFEHIGPRPTKKLDPPVPDDALESPADADAVQERFLRGELCYALVESGLQTYTMTREGTCVPSFTDGKLYITNYRCIFTLNSSSTVIKWQVPVLTIAAIQGMNTPAASPTSSPNGGNKSMDATYYLVLRCKDLQVARFAFKSFSEYNNVVKCLDVLAFPKSLMHAFCFSYSPLKDDRRMSFDMMREYDRIGLLSRSDRLRVFDQSSRYSMCPTYPRYVVVPAHISDKELYASASFRSQGRLPVISWLHPRNGATIARCSQPLVGFKSARNPHDENLVQALCCATAKHSFGRYMIMDVRSQMAAMGNKAMGKGTEIAANYKGSKLLFMNIDNIHSIRQSLQQLAAIFEPPLQGLNHESSSSSYYGKVDATGWLRHVRLILKASVELAMSVQNGISVLAHCSDGWDRTAQMVSLAEFLLDPYYRTLEGFACLIEKEWASFGHQFASRCGHTKRDMSNDQRSPVFLLWLDCVWQFVRQFPSECEFNERLLLALADHTHSCKYWNFLFDCEKQRVEALGRGTAASIWDDVYTDEEDYTNQFFAPSENDELAIPNTLSKNIKLWKGYFCRWDPTFVPPVPAWQSY